MNYEAIPEELRNYNNWICWRAEPDPRKDDPAHISKKPIDPKTGGLASSTDSSTWTDFDTAVSASGKYSGIGFVFTDSPFFGVDIDKRGDDIRAYRSGDMNNIIGTFISTLGSYTELSQSGNGIHIICRGSLPEGRRRKGDVEMYDTGRFFVMTGNPLGNYPVSDCTEKIKSLHAEYLAQNEQKRSSVPAVPSRGYNYPMNIEERLQRARSGSNGEKFSALMAGDFEDYYSSQSEADLALCNMLVFWLGRDETAVDSVFRSSGLMRDKWDRKQSGSTYGALTVRKAVTECAAVFGERPAEPGYHITISGESKDIGQIRYKQDDTGNAQRLTDLYGERLRYCYQNKLWYYWTGKVWAADNTGTIDRIADDSLQAMEKEAMIYVEDPDALKKFQKHIHSSRSSKAKTAMKKEFQHKVPITQDQFNRDWYYFNTQDGMIDLRTCSMVPHDKDRYINRISGTGISTDDCPVWKNFLDTILGNDRELVRFVQKALGYSLSGTNAEQCFFFLLGSGSNGKSTMMDIIRKVFGEYAANAQAETIMIKGTAAAGAARSDIARLKDVRLLTVSEPEEGSRLNESLMKQFVGGDPLTTRFNYGIDFEYVPCLVPWIPTNYKPIIRGTDQGIWRRIRIIPFRVEIPDSKKDKQLPAKLARELPMIANWVLDGYKLYRSEGLHPPAVVSDAVREYRREMDVVSSFITECCILGQGSEKSSVLYAVYIRWAETNNEFKLSHRRFSAELAKKDGIEKVRSDGMIYKGITILDEYKYE